jgi:radical SAM superfamily enzyme YgiQ (UPF0313 family)
MPPGDKNKVLLVNPSYKIPIGTKYEKYFIRSGSRWPHSGVKRKKTLPHYLPFPIFLAYAAAWLKQESFDVEALDCVALDWENGQLVEYITKEKPDLIFFETTTPTIALDFELMREIRKIHPSAVIVLGGPHSTVHGRDVLTESTDANFVIRGEFEETLVNLARAVLRGEGDPYALKGISFRRDGQVVENENAPLIDPIEKLPRPAYEMLPCSWKPDPGVYWDGFCQRRPALQMHASRGCPYTCDFCLWIQVMYRNGKYRMFTPARIVDEMLWLQSKFGAKEIYFDDDDFAINKKHVRDLCDELIRREAKINWSCMGDAINFDQDILKLMAQSGCIGIKFGVETGSKDLVKTVGKPLDLDRVRDIVKWCGDYGIKTHATFTLGLYGESEKTLQETYTYLENLDVDTIQVSICTPFPGTAFYKKATKNGILTETDWSRYDGKVSEVLERSADTLLSENMRRKAMRRWLLKRMTSPTWLKKQFNYGQRVLGGLGVRFFVIQIYSLIVDEWLLPLGLGSNPPAVEETV